jgi:hypothetical protein
MKPLDVCQRIDFRGALVYAQPHDAWKPEGEAGLVPVGALDDVERNLDHYDGVDLPEPAELVNGMRLEPARHLRDLGISQAGVGLADGDQSIL